LQPYNASLCLIIADDDVIQAGKLYHETIDSCRKFWR